jgi:hypothetical protein
MYIGRWCQAVVENIPILSNDPSIAAYSVLQIW